MKRVLFVINHSTFGGPHNQALQLNDRLLRYGWHTIVVLPDEHGNAECRLKHGGVSVIKMSLHRITIRRSISYQLQYLSRYWKEVQALRAIINGRSLAGMFPSIRRLEDRWIVFYPPVDTALFRPDDELRHAARADMAVPEGALVIGTVANVNPYKGHEFLVRAAARIRRARQDVVIRVLAADTGAHLEYRHRIESEARALGLLDGRTLEFVDPVHGVWQLLPGFDVFLLTSVSEGIPTTILEAMSSGLPIVATNVGGVSEAVVDGRSGFIVPPRDPVAIAQYDASVSTAAHIRAYEAAVRHQVNTHPALARHANHRR
jgi:glycosyltransferase involved in cell wall biosynthesis